MPGTLKSLYGSLSWPDVAARDRVEQIRRTFADPRAAEFELIREQAARPALTALQQQELERVELRRYAKFERQRVAAEESMRELQSQGYAWEPAPSPPERQYCACGQELRTPRAQGRRICGDCFSQFRRGQQGITASPSLAARIAAAKSADLDPTSEWGAGATPGYDWEGR
jgi:hypothetical protein